MRPATLVSLAEPRVRAADSAAAEDSGVELMPHTHITRSAGRLCWSCLAAW